ncbi:type II secretion system F family protein [soil metagenome]
MRQLILLLIIFLCATTGVVLLLYVIALIRKARPSERTHMDPLPIALRVLWPAINILQFHVSEIMPTSMLVKRKRQLQLAGLEFVLRAEEFIAVQIVSMLIVGGLGLWTAGMLNAVAGTKVWVMLMGCVLGWFYPIMWMRDKRKRRDKDILRTLPGYLDMITLCCQAGLSLTGAIAQAVQKGPKGALGEEFDRMMREMRTGASRMDALNALADRLDNRHIKSLVSNLTQAESLGASLADTLSAISDQRRTERFQHAEKLAMEAPVKMIGPLVIFIFPVTFIIIFFPLVMEFLASTRTN